MAKKRHFIKKWLPWQPDSYLATLYLHWVNLKTYESMLQSCFYVYYFLKYSNLFNFKGLFRKSMVAMEMATKHILSEDGDNPNINFCKGCFSNYAMLFKLFCSIMVRGIPIRSQCIGGHIKLHYNSIHPYFWHYQGIQWFPWKPSSDQQICTLLPEVTQDQMLHCCRHLTINFFTRFAIVNIIKK